TTDPVAAPGRPRKKLCSNPNTSVLWPTARPPSNTIVLTAPTAAASGDRSSRYGTTSRLQGWVTFRPRKPRRRAPARTERATSSALPHRSRAPGHEGGGTKRGPVSALEHPKTGSGGRAASATQSAHLRRRDADRTRRDILDAATAEFSDRGYSGGRVDEIAA